MPSLNDITAPFDPTNYSEISGAQLLQLVSGATPYNDKGLVFRTIDTGVVPDVPDPRLVSDGGDNDDKVKWQNYIWLRQMATSAAIYIWNEEGVVDATYLKWVAVGIGTIPDSAITTAMIADGAVTDDKIDSVDYSKINNVPFPTYPSQSIPTSAIKNDAVTPVKLSSTDVATGRVPRVASDGISFEYFDQKIITQLNNPASVADAGKPVVVNGAGTGYVIGSVLSQTILQTVEAVDATALTANNTTETIPATGAPTTSTGKTIAGLALSITPLSAASKIEVEIVAYLAGPLNAASAIALYEDLAVNAVAVASISHGDNVNAGPDCVVLKYVVTPGSTDEIDFAVRFGSGGAYASYYNRTVSGNTFGGLIKSRIKITERL